MSSTSPSAATTQVAQWAYGAGFRGNALALFTAIGLAESSGNADVINNNPKTGDYSVGVWQINYLPGSPTSGNSLYNERTAAFGPPAALQNGPANAAAAYSLSNGGTSAGPWSTFKNGAYLYYLPQAIAAANQVQGGNSKVTTASVTSYAANLGGPTAALQTAGGTTSLNENQTQTPTPANWCGAQQDLFRIDLKVTTVSMTACQGKAILGGTLIVAGGLLCLAGVVLVIAVGVKGRKLTPVGAVKSVVAAPQAHRERAATKATTQARTATARSTTEQAPARAQADQANRESQAIRRHQAATKATRPSTAPSSSTRTTNEQRRQAAAQRARARSMSEGQNDPDF